MRLAILVSSTALALLALTPGTLAGDNNDVFIRQLSPSGTLNGNTLSIDQSAANNSSVKGAGPGLFGGLPLYLLGTVADNDPLIATQRGEGNSAKLKLTGTGGELQLFQSSDPSAPWVAGGAMANNVAEMTSAGASLGGIIQIGALNEAMLTLDNSQGLISQLGFGLTAALNVAPSGKGTIVQVGSNSTTGTINVGIGTSLTYTQIGNNLTPSSAATVYSSNPGNIIITQTSW